MYKLCIFDLDGTLLDTVESMAYSANLALRELGYNELPAEQFRYFAGDGLSELVKRCLRQCGDHRLQDFDRMAQLYREHFAVHCMRGVAPYPGIITLLEQLKAAQIKITVLSNKPHDQAVEVVETVFGMGYFAEIQGQREDVPRKPDPTGALRILERTGIAAADCLYIGDTDTDMQTGRNAGLRTVGVLWGFRDRAELEANGAADIIAAPDEIRQIATGQK